MNVVNDRERNWRELDPQVFNFREKLRRTCYEFLLIRMDACGHDAVRCYSWYRSDNSIHLLLYGGKREYCRTESRIPSVNTGQICTVRIRYLSEMQRCGLPVAPKIRIPNETYLQLSHLIRKISSMWFDGMLSANGDQHCQSFSSICGRSQTR